MIPLGDVKSKIIVKGIYDTNVLLKFIATHQMKSKFEIFLPGVSYISMDEIFSSFLEKTSLNQNCFFYHVKTYLISLFEENFFHKYILSGGFTAISVNSRIDGGNCLAWFPNGTLILSLDQDSFHLLGLPGRRSKFYSRYSL